MLFALTVPLAILVCVLKATMERTVRHKLTNAILTRVLTTGLALTCFQDIAANVQSSILGSTAKTKQTSAYQDPVRMEVHAMLIILQVTSIAPAKLVLQE